MAQELFATKRLLSVMHDFREKVMKQLLGKDYEKVYPKKLY